MSCACISGARQVMLEFDAMEQSLSEDLSSLPHWSRRNDKVWSVEVGGQSGYRTPEDIANFLTAFLSDELLDSIACSWDSEVDQGCCRKSCGPSENIQCGRTSLAQFASKTSSPLLEILKGNQL